MRFVAQSLDLLCVTILDPPLDCDDSSSLIAFDNLRVTQPSPDLLTPPTAPDPFHRVTAKSLQRGAVSGEAIRDEKQRRAQSAPPHLLDKPHNEMTIAPLANCAAEPQARGGVQGQCDPDNRALPLDS